MLVMEPVVEAEWDETAYLERDPVLMQQFADDKKGLTSYITFTEEEWEEYNEKSYTKATWKLCVRFFANGALL
jgi:hypothetical protein